jgi:glycosyltransferase involved in cell wall biosynthesis
VSKLNSNVTKSRDDAPRPDVRPFNDQETWDGALRSKAQSMRVLHCILSMGNGGAERQLSYLAGELVARGVETHVAMAYPGSNLERLERSGCTVHLLPPTFRRDPVVGWKLWNLVRRLKPDVLQTWLTHMDILGGVVALERGIPWVVSEGSSAAGYPPTLLNRLRRRIAGKADWIISNSQAGRDYWRAEGIDESRLLVVPNGLPMNEIEAAVPALPPGVPESDLVLFVGRFSPEKNLQVLARALELLLSRRRDTIAVLCGDGPLRPELERLVVALGIGDRVFFPGHLPQVWSVMKKAAVLVSVGLYEGQPNVVMEAMACRLPVILSDIPGHREVVGEAGLLVPADSPEAVAEAIGVVLDSSSQLSEKVRCDRQRAFQWSLEQLASEHVNVYSAAVGSLR